MFSISLMVCVEKNENTSNLTQQSISKNYPQGSYLAHTQGKKHQINLARRQQREKEQKAVLIRIVSKFSIISSGMCQRKSVFINS